jgi:hypothetical protein
LGKGVCGFKKDGKNGVNAPAADDKPANEPDDKSKH